MAKSKRRLLVLFNPNDPSDPGAGNSPLGDEAAFFEKLAPYNTGEDSPKRPGAPTHTLYGPGMSVEYATAQDPIMQAMVAVNEVDTAFPVLSKLCRELGWKMQDTDSGQVFG
ncbi:MAG: hypothetical protein ACF8Q5_02300 [Phycisphaerales bacterium JB040]